MEVVGSYSSFRSSSQQRLGETTQEEQEDGGKDVCKNPGLIVQLETERQVVWLISHIITIVLPMQPAWEKSST